MWIWCGTRLSEICWMHLTDSHSNRNIPTPVFLGVLYLWHHHRLKMPLCATDASVADLVLSIFEKVDFMTKSIRIAVSLTIAGAALFLSSVTAQAMDAEAAKALARQNNCLKCHSIDKEKEGPAYSKVAAKYKGKSTAEARLIEHITSGEKAKFVDGHEEEHKIVKTSPPKDMEQIRNLVQWILAQ
ncbi:MAG: hypothetical protein RL302_2701 [Pseudomonadota bacterium]|jgi:cytochrome c